MRKRFVMAAVAVLALAWAKPSAADTVTFDVSGTGGGDVVNATGFDWIYGNSLLIEGANGTAQLFYQANLNSVTTTTGTVANGTDGNYFTAVAAFDAVLVAPGTYAVTPGGTFNIYSDAEGGNDLSGQGFAADAGSTLVLSGHAVAGGGNVTLGAPVGQLDQFTPALSGPQYGGTQAGGDNYPTVQSLTGFGGFNITVDVDFTNSSFFLSNPNAILVGATNTGSNSLPYNLVNPSAFFSSNGVADADQAGVSLVGPINGTCADLAGNPLPVCAIMSQSDANSSFTAVPEPASLTLLGLGLAGSAAARRRQKKAQQA